MIERPEVKALHSLCSPESHGVNSVGSIAGNWGVMWDSADHFFRNPGYP